MNFNFNKIWDFFAGRYIPDLYLPPITIPSTPLYKVKKIKCALVIGHKKSSPGAHNEKHDISEFEFNEQLALDIENHIFKDIEIQKVYRRTYSSLPYDINEIEPDFIISLHCNAFNTSATGTETLYYHKSKTGKKIAQILNNEIVNCLKLKDRGIKAKSAEDRGGYLLKETDAPCIIAEPFFIDNNFDLEIAQNNRWELVDTYITAIIKISKFI